MFIILFYVFMLISGQVVINSPIFKELQYQKASEIFHQWSDGKLSYGLNFASPQDANAFSGMVNDCVNKLKGTKINI